jgi:hypothetical protein
MADFEDDSTFHDLTSRIADVRVASEMTEGAYRILRRIFRGSTYYLTRHDMDVEASLLNEKSNSQIVSHFSRSWPLYSSYTVERQTTH